MQEAVCRYCGMAYIVNPRLNDGYCDGCREEINQEVFEVEQQIIQAGCDPHDPESHDYRRVGESHTPDGRTILYECVRCGVQDTS